MNITESRKQDQAIRRVQQALRKNPGDIATLLGLASKLGTDFRQKRKLLRYILSLAPSNPQARQMLLELDRLEIGGRGSHLSLALMLPDPSPSSPPESPLTLRYSIVHQLLVYAFILCALLLSLRLVRDAEGLAIAGSLLLLMIIPLWFVSAVIELGENGIKVFRLLGLIRSEIQWRQIKECKPTAFGKGVRIITHQGKTVEVSAQVHGYPFIVDILAQRRPDLFESTKDFTGVTALKLFS